MLFGIFSTNNYIISTIHWNAGNQTFQNCNLSDDVGKNNFKIFKLVTFKM